MTSIRRSRSPHRGFESSYKYYSKSSKPRDKYHEDGDGNRTSRFSGERVDRASSRYDSGSKPPRKEKQSAREKRSSIHYDSVSSDEDSYLKSGNEHKLDENWLDPSTCNFKGVPDTSGKETTDYSEKKKGKEKLPHKEDDRLDRLERLVELLVKPQLAEASTSQSAPSNIENLELIPRNTNFTTSMWLNKIQEECIKRNLDEGSSIKFLESKMTGIIKAWFEEITFRGNYENYKFCWPELRMEIISLFPDNVDFASTLRLLVEKCKTSEDTITGYYFSKMYLLDACKITGANAVSCIIDGLDDQHLKEEAKKHNFLLPEALFSVLLSNYEFDTRSKEDHKKSQPDHESKEADIEPTDDVDIEPIAERQAIRERKTRKLKTMKCFTCNKFGHQAAECRHAPICYYCNRKGHIMANCSTRLNHSDVSYKLY